jgi:8-oxo-dGTP diphosphatase
MPISPYVAELRERVGHDLLLVPCAAAIVHDEQGRVLLQRRSDTGTWDIPGGAVDPEEQPAQACAREVYEETGLVVRPLSVVAVETHPITTYPNGDVVQPIVTVFSCEVVGGRLEPLDGEALELAFFSPDELPDEGIVDRFPAGAFDTGRHTAAFRWDDAWLPRTR